jgi:2-aminoethylphosphonate dioxygenase
MLDAAQETHWARHGWLWLRRFLTADEVQALRVWTEEIVAWPEVPGRWMRYYEKQPGGGKMLARIENFVPYHAPLAALFAAPRFQDLLAALCGEPVVLFKDKINLKLPGGAGFAPHQDAPAYLHFGVEHHLTVMVPVDPFTADNGCLEMAVGQNARVILPSNPDGTVRADVMAGLHLEPITAAPGDVIVFDAWVPHRSGPNRSPGPRRSYYLTFNPASAGDQRAAYYVRKRELFPPEYERRPGVDYARLGAQFNLANPFD